MRIITPLDFDWSEKAEKVQSLDTRIKSRKPIKICDDEKKWDTIWKDIFASRQPKKKVKNSVKKTIRS